MIWTSQGALIFLVGYGSKSNHHNLVPGKWTEEAICRSMDPEIFFPTRSDKKTVRIATAACASCPVISKCLDHALRVQKNSFYGLQGIWGGTDERARGKILARISKSSN